MLTAGNVSITTAVASLVDVAEPAAFVPVSTTRSVAPTSATRSVNVAPEGSVGSVTLLQEAPRLSHRRH